MKVLVLYSTTEGQTRKIATFVAERLRHAGDDVTLKDATEVEWDFWVGAFDAVIIAASIHAGQYQAATLSFVRQHFDRLNHIPSLFLSVSLSAADSDPEARRTIVRCAEEMSHVSGWKADVRHVAGAFRFTQYDFFKRMVMNAIAWQKGKAREAANGDLELTDWTELSEVIDDFRKRATGTK